MSEEIKTCDGENVIRDCPDCKGAGYGNFFGSTTLRDTCKRCGGQGVIKVKIIKSRPNWDQYFLGMLEAVKLRASCPRRQCSAILVDDDHNILATGYNGPPPGIENCFENPCGGQDDRGGDTSRCAALHAEHNAIYYAGDRRRYAETLYCTNQPCFKCALEICQTNIKRVIFLEPYPDDRALKLFEQKGIELEVGKLYDTEK